MCVKLYLGYQYIYTHIFDIGEDLLIRYREISRTYSIPVIHVIQCPLHLSFLNRYSLRCGSEVSQTLQATTSWYQGCSGKLQSKLNLNHPTAFEQRQKPGRNLVSTGLLMIIPTTEYTDPFSTA